MMDNMTESEAIEKLKNMRLFMQIEDEKNDCKFTEDDYEANEKAIRALEKQMPMKPRNERRSVPMSSTSVRFVDWYKCGKCNSDLSRQFVCCPYCQSVIDWSDENDD